MQIAADGASMILHPVIPGQGKIVTIHKYILEIQARAGSATGWVKTGDDRSHLFGLLKGNAASMFGSDVNIT